MLIVKTKKLFCCFIKMLNFAQIEIISHIPFAGSENNHSVILLNMFFTSPLIKLGLRKKRGE